MKSRAPRTVMAAVALTCATGAAAPTGDRHVEYEIAPGIESAYRLYVPEDWTPGRHWPLVVILHGGGADENSPFDKPPAFTAELEATARAHHFILLSPRGHKGWWGAAMLAPESDAATGPGIYRMPPAGAITGQAPKLPPLSAEDRALARRSVDASIDAVHRAYGIDPRRIYLMGNSMGSVGALHLAQENPGRWCAIAPSDGPVDPATFPFARVKGLRAALFVHGDDDRVAPIESMLAIAQGFERVGVPTRFRTVKGGRHDDSWRRVVGEIFDFFAATDCRAKF